MVLLRGLLDSLRPPAPLVQKQDETRRLSLSKSEAFDHVQDNRRKEIYVFRRFQLVVSIWRVLDLVLLPLKQTMQTAMGQSRLGSSVIKSKGRMPRAGKVFYKQ